MIKSVVGQPPARVLTSQADAARDEHRYRDAAALYVAATRLRPDRGDLHMQAGHMFKEAREFNSAEHHYNEAARLMPDNAEVALQLGHFYKTALRHDEATSAYQRANEIAPDWDEPKRELAVMAKGGWHSAQPYRTTTRAQPVILADDLEPETRPDDLKLAGMYGRVAPELLPQPLREMLRYSDDSMSLRQFGVEQNSFWGHKRIVRGVEAIRGVCISKKLLVSIEASVNGLPIYRGSLKGPYELEYEPDKDRIHKYVFNIWYDFTPFVRGLQTLELTAIAADGERRRIEEPFVIEPPLLEEEHPDSDGVINLDPDVSGTIEEQLQARPSIAHEAERANQIGEVKTILVCRSDQLGDFVASIPAILKLREIFPQARLVGLFSPSNADLARSLSIFENIILVNHAESWHQRKRVLPLDVQEELRAQLEPYEFDLAIDLSQSLMGRPLLLLSGARVLYGFRDPGWSRLTSSYDDTLLDPKNRREVATHSKRIYNMIERLHTLSNATGKIIRRDDLPRERLLAFGIGPQDRYAALHTGARIVWSRWPHYVELASRLLQDTDLKVVIFTGDPDFRDNLPEDLQSSNRVIVLDGQLPFDDFDALLSYCDIYVGNDSGPKHLAGLRGVPVVSIHSARINWSEWGQEHTGVIISRKVPCAGCHIYHDPDECGKDFACMAIGFDDVYRQVRRFV